MKQRIKRCSIKSTTDNDVNVAIGKLWDELFYDVASELENYLDKEIESIYIYKCNINLSKLKVKLKLFAFTSTGEKISSTIKYKFVNLASESL